MQRVVQKVALHPAGGKGSGDLQFWLSQPVAARLAAVELLRQQMWGPDAERRLQRVCRVIHLKPGHLKAPHLKPPQPQPEPN